MHRKCFLWLPTLALLWVFCELYSLILTAISRGMCYCDLVNILNKNWYINFGCSSFILRAIRLSFFVNCSISLLFFYSIFFFSASGSSLYVNEMSVVCYISAKYFLNLFVFWLGLFSFAMQICFLWTIIKCIDILFCGTMGFL